MSQVLDTAKPALKRIWKSAQLYIGFHRDQQGQQRDTAKTWPPKNGNATIHKDPSEQEAFLIVKADKDAGSGDVQVKLRPDSIVLRREPFDGWEGIKVAEDEVAVKINDTWIKIAADGSVTQQTGENFTIIEGDGRVIKYADGVQARMSSDGLELARKTENDFRRIRTDGMVSKTD